ncbi:SecY-interacting protein [Thalassomonas viridans]|uniref:Protein Syd n=1 Tax=Thalassomonas viridans TaxID=137584 RepID=A0AAE9Z6C0_9GAMM|nr:SecY-interacting protein [Thalassomonas viridans]WDE06909.1 SecY-interacting protein [Thalassomonas viridans]
MKSTNQDLADKLWHFVDSYIESYQKVHGHLPVAELDEDWPSSCQQGLFTPQEKHGEQEQQILWQPVKADGNLCFNNIESALELELHPDIKNYFTVFHSDPLDALCQEGQLSLLFAWNENDFERLQENIIGHVLMKRKLKQRITVFFAITDEEDLILSLDNETGAVWVERVGCEPHKKLADSMAEFIAGLTPHIPA